MCDVECGGGATGEDKRGTSAMLGCGELRVASLTLGEDLKEWRAENNTETYI